MNQDILRRRSELSADKLQLLEKRLKGKYKPASEPQVIPRRGHEDSTPLSFAQQRLWFIDLMETGSPFYNVPVAVRLKGVLNVPALEQTLSEVIRRHESLRTNFVTVDGQPMQTIDVARPAHLPVLDLSALETDERDAEALRLTATEMRKPFDLTCDPLLRTTLLRLGEDEHIALLTMHHIISDAWSVGVLVQEVVALYKAFSAGEPSPLAELPIQYADYAAWQREWLTGDVLQAQLNYWKQQLEDAPPVLELPTDRPRPATQSYHGSFVSLALGGQLSEQLNALCQKEGVTLYMLLLAAFQTLLSRYSGQTDIVVGTPIAGRTQVETESLIGFFVNTLALRNDLSGNPTFREFLQSVREVVLEAYANQDIPFEKLVEELAPERSLRHAPLVQVLFTLQNTPQGTLEMPGLTLSPAGVETRTAKFDMTLGVIESTDGINAVWDYSTDLFDEATIQRMLSHFHNLLQAICAQPDTHLDDLSLLSDAERHQQLFACNQTEYADPALDLRLHQLFEHQVERTPDAIALVFEQEQLSYRELNNRANQLAHHLQSLGVCRESLVGVMMERSTEMVVSLLAIVKAGAAYVPLDPAYPQERLAFMLADAGVEVLLTQLYLSDRLAAATSLDAPSFTTLYLDPELAEVAHHSTANPDVAVKAENAAYMIYTSGSTGRPKGVVNTHGGIVNRLLWMQQQYQLTEADRVLQKTPFSFDVSVWEFFWPLMTGARLVVARPGGHQDASYLVRTIREQGITTLHFVPSMLQVFLEEREVEECRSVRRVMSSGEALTVETQERFFERMSNAELHNLYGPTEAAVDVSYWACAAGTGRRSVPIGRPIANTQLYVLDGRMEPVAVGVSGEIYIGGAGLARGYKGRAELTAEKFVPNPHSREKGARLYRTGDVGRRLEGGEIEYLGRVDDQVKIRGFRIELGEVASVIREQVGVRECVVIAREESGGEKRLVAYVVGEQGAGELSTSELRAELKKRLPEYMMPSAIVMMEEMPLMKNGKVDRSALAEVKEGRGVDEKSYVAPRTPVEEIIAGIFIEVLSVERVGIFDNFFDLGGHSLLVTLVVSRLREAFHVELPLRAVFESPTVADLSLAIAESIMEEENGNDIAELLGEVEQFSGAIA
jgi:amino acid adenylation domain-containing protein